MNKTPKKLALSLALLAALSGPLLAADSYVTVNGAGAKTGVDWANAKAATALAATCNGITPGSTVYLGSGDYGGLRFKITNPGTATDRKALVGVDTGGGLPSFVGTETTRGYTTFEIVPGVGYWTIKDIKIAHRAYGVTAGIPVDSHPEWVGPNPGIILDGLQIRDVSEGATDFINADDLLIQNCRAARYKKAGFNVRHSCDNVIIRNCVADCSDTGLVDDIPYRSKVVSPVGFNFNYNTSTNPPNTNILIEDCESLNNNEDTTNPDDFEQGDGFKTEGDNIGVTINRCRAYRNQDANYDLKGSNQVINDSFAGGGRAGFKTWYDATLNNCIAIGNSQQWTLASSQTLSFTANNCTFHNTSTSQFGAVTNGSNTTVYLNNCLFTNSTNATNYRNNNGSTWVLNNYHSHNYAANPANAPLYNNAVWPWYGVGTNYDNNTYGLTAGYNSTVSSVEVGGTLSVSLSDAANALAATDEVGAIPSLNWTSSSTGNQALSNVIDHDGAATTADETFSGTTYGYNNNTGTLAAPMDDDAKMMRSQRATSNTSNMQATVTQVPYPAYDVYVYWGGRTAAETVPATMTLELQLLSGGVYTTSATGYIKDTNRTWDGTYDKSTATTAAAAVDGQEYVVFRNITDPQFRIKSTMGSRTGFSGFQIVEQ